MQNITFCPYCGRRRIGTEKYCSNCGHLLPQQIITYKKKKKSDDISLIWIAVFVVIIFLFGFFNGLLSNESEESNGYRNESTSLYVHNLFSDKTTYSIQSIKSIREMEKAIQNTIWTHTKTGDIWFKLEFGDEIVRIYKAFPSDGKWTFSEECTYTLEEGRFFDNGKRYIAAVIKSDEFDISAKFTITNGHLYLWGIDVAGFTLGDYEWD